jgi:hypothetical protein
MIEKEDALSLVNNSGIIDETALFEHVAAIIENRKARAGAYANREITLMRWEVVFFVSSVLLDGERAAYGKKIVTKLSSQLMSKYGKSFDVHNLRRMMRFAERFDDDEDEDE